MEPDEETGAFAETVRRLWEVHSSDLRRLQAENQRLRQKIQSLEGKDLSIPGVVPGASAITLQTQTMEESSESPKRDKSSLQHQPRSAWAKVLPQRTADEDVLFAPEEEGDLPSSFWTLSTRLVSNPMFDVATACLILLNAIVMAVESQLQGLSVGATLQYSSLGSEHQAAWASAESVFKVSGYIFGVIFTIELLVKLVGQRADFPRHVWNWIDSFIITAWIVSITAGNLPIDPTLLRLARLARLLRLLRVLHTFRSLDALYIITTALSGSFSTLAWACVLFFVVQMALALLLTNVLTSTYLSDESIPLTNRQEVYVYFGTFTRSIYSMFEITLANWPPVSRLLAENVSEWYMLFGVLHKLAIGFAVVSVVNGVFMQETFSVASSDDRVMIQKRNRMLQTHKMKMKRFFARADKSKNGSIDIEEFREMMEHNEVGAWLASMELDPSDAGKLFNLIDSVKRDGSITLEELIHGVGRLKGPARSLDMACMLEEMKDLKALLQGGIQVSPKNSMEGR